MLQNNFLVFEMLFQNIKALVFNASNALKKTPNSIAYIVCNTFTPALHTRISIYKLRMIDYYVSMSQC